MNKNIGKLERIIRVVVGIELLSLAFVGPECGAPAAASRRLSSVEVLDQHQLGLRHGKL